MSGQAAAAPVPSGIVVHAVSRVLELQYPSGECFRVPFRCMGTGSARLAVAALQSAESALRHFLLIDEIEYGLEPHRISLLVSHLRKRVKSGGQVFITTHSTSVLREVRFGEVFVCHGLERPSSRCPARPLQ